MSHFLETKCQVQSATLTRWSKCCIAKFNFDQVVNEDQNSCVDATASSWEILVDSDWQQDETATVTCARSITPYVDFMVISSCIVGIELADPSL